jgi:hypothetical protein
MKNLLKLCMLHSLALLSNGCTPTYLQVPADPPPPDLRDLGIRQILTYTLNESGDFAVAGGTAIPLGGERLLVSLHVIHGRDVLQSHDGAYHTFEIIERSHHDNPGMDWAVIDVSGLTQARIRGRLDGSASLPDGTNVFVIGYPGASALNPVAYLSQAPTVLRGVVTATPETRASEVCTTVLTHEFDAEGMSGGAVVIRDGDDWVIARIIQMSATAEASSGFLTLAKYRALYTVPFSISQSQQFEITPPEALPRNAGLSAPDSAPTHLLDTWDLNEDGTPDVARDQASRTILILHAATKAPSQTDR